MKEFPADKLAILKEKMPSLENVVATLKMANVDCLHVQLADFEENPHLFYDVVWYFQSIEIDVLVSEGAVAEITTQTNPLIPLKKGIKAD